MPATRASAAAARAPHRSAGLSQSLHQPGAVFRPIVAARRSAEAAREIKQLMREWERRFPGRVENVFASLGRVAPSHLMDRERFDFAGLRSPDAVTADFVYIRLHGPLKEPYRGGYPDSFLQERAEAIRRWLGEGRAVYVFFDNTMEGDAVRDALKLADLLKEKTSPEKLL